MGRKAWVIRRDFGVVHDVGSPWWGFMLDRVRCQACAGAGHVDGTLCGWCPVCDGEGTIRPRVDPPGWEADKAPKWALPGGHSASEYGWQMWEDTSEGSPISPVCDTPKALAQWLADNKASAFADMTMTADEWLRAILSAGVPGMVVCDGDAKPLVCG